MEIQFAFHAQLVDHTGEGTLTDGGVLYEIVTNDGERIASCTTKDAADQLEQALNLTLTDWVEEDEDDRVVS